jgi:hypothetical protein
VTGVNVDTYHIYLINMHLVIKFLIKQLYTKIDQNLFWGREIHAIKILRYSVIFNTKVHLTYNQKYI